MAILGARLVHVRKVYPHPPFPIGFLDHYHICQPIRVVYFSNEAYFLQFANFFCYFLVSFLGEHPLLLIDGWKRRRYIQLMYHNQGVDSWHVFMALSKYVLVHFEKIRKRLANHQAGEGADSCGPI